MTEITLPKYVEKAIKDRSKCIANARIAEQIIDNYAAKIGITPGTEAYDEACLATDIRIFCEVDCSEKTTRDVLLRELRKRCMQSR